VSPTQVPKIATRTRFWNVGLDGWRACDHQPIPQFFRDQVLANLFSAIHFRKISPQGCAPLFSVKIEGGLAEIKVLGSGTTSIFLFLHRLRKSVNACHCR
jgi:hypothetical protein